ncbi:helix-turn-helix transcriptional regulator [Bosea sp. 124]|uniref:helix-turn-helix transcriptional regulator n=1 Tax=Bosea sp. 124 TaxID=2135642 RepID=UPI000D34575D|nr:helix-turn-helix transcriptional regulator [Bosea sp. 124]PTM39613.1 AraC-like DNA-binding protein [Bosea sp. 124]
MAARANASSQPSPGPFLVAATVGQGMPGDRIGEWISADACTVALLPVPRAAPECQEALSEWLFGDLVLTRNLRRSGQPGLWPQQAWRYRGRGCVVLLRLDQEGSASTLVVSPHGNLDLPALAWPPAPPGQDGEILTLFLPTTGREDREPDETALMRQLDIAAGPGALLADFMRQLARQLARIPDDQASLLAAATRALVTACCTVATTRRLAPVPPPVACGMVERMRLVVQRNMGSPDFGPPQLARLLAMSRSKLYRLLDRDGGVAHFINRERLAQAWRDLANPGEAVSVHAIASQVGFRDHSTFSRAFRREFGCSPTEARERALLAVPQSLAPTLPHPAAQGNAAITALDPARALPLQKRAVLGLSALRAQSVAPLPGAEREAAPENGMNSPDLGF